jgi:nucleotide-binding universal stress UspA family protein
MIMFKNILVPLDGTPFAEHALPLAASIARQSGATLRLLQVLPPLADRFFWAPLPGTELERDLNERYRTQAQTYLQGVSRRLNGGLRVVCDMLDEQVDIPTAIDTGVANGGIDLVVMVSHGRGALKRFWLGSIADQVYRSAAVPVLLARPQPGAVDFERESQIRQIVVTLDGSALAEQVFDSVLKIGLATNAELRVVRVIPPPLPKQATDEFIQADKGVTIDDRVRNDPWLYMRAIEEMLRVRGARVQTQLLASENPAQAITEAASGADLIAMQTHARRGVSRLVHGSIVDKVVHDSSIPVFINRPRD